ncbi:OVARIAN TUMOR DOMAIN-containing deubiquitinating enzyme 1-like [Carex rostrata]
MQGIEKQMAPFVGGKEPLSALAAEFESGNSIFFEQIQLLGEKYTALRRTRGDGNCFYRSFMFSYLEHILVTHNKAEVERVMFCIEKCKMDLVNLGYPKLSYEVFFALFTELLENCLPGTEAFFSLTDLLGIACDQMTSDCAVMFLRFVTSAAIQKRAEFFYPFGPFHKSIVEFCKSSVEQMGEESEEVHIIALCGTLGVPIRVVYLNARSSGDPANPNAPNHHDFFPYDQEKVQNNGSDSTDAANVSTVPGPQENRAPFVTLLYQPGHYDILYPM